MASYCVFCSFSSETPDELADHFLSCAEKSKKKVIW